MPVVAQSQACVCGRSHAGTAGSISTGALISVSYECCELSGRGLCDGPITRPEESYCVWCRSVIEEVYIGGLWPLGLSSREKRKRWIAANYSLKRKVCGRLSWKSRFT